MERGIVSINFWLHWWKSQRNKNARQRTATARGFRPQLESLEDRRLLTTNPGPGALIAQPGVSAATPTMTGGTAEKPLGQEYVSDSSHPDGSIYATPIETGKDGYGRPIYSVPVSRFDNSTVMMPVFSDDDGRPYVNDPDTGQPRYIDEEYEQVDQPQQVSGTFLWGGESYRADTSAFSFDDIEQQQSDTCTFAAALSAVARSNVNLATGITLKKIQSDGSDVFSVRMYLADSGGAFHPYYVQVAYDGNIYPTDLQSTDTSEFWPTLYQRAYLDFMQNVVHKDYHLTTEAFKALTGQLYTSFVPNGDARTQALQIQTDLNQGHPIVAGSRDNGPLVLDSSGLIHDHAYTVIGVEVPPSGSSGIYVTLRNPWAADTDWNIFDTNHDGALSDDNGEYVAWLWGLDGSNDGIIRVPWSTFTSDFTSVTVSNVAGPPSNTPLAINPPVFWNAYDHTTQTTHEGEPLNLDLWAYDPDGGSVFYSLKAGSPGYVNPQSGQYTWEPLSGQAGLYTVTVIAEVDFPSLIKTASLTFQINVASGAPHINSLTPSRGSIEDDGSDQLILTANGVTTDIGQIAFVEFYRDANGNGIFEPSQDVWMGKDENGADGWSWTGYVGGLTPGSQKFFARAGRFSYTDLHDSNVVAASVAVTAAPVVPPAAIAVTNQQVQASPTAAYEQDGYALGADASGNFRVFWDTPSNGTYTRKFDAAGNPLTGAQSLIPSDNGYEGRDAVVMADGTFGAIWTSGANLYIQWFNAAGTATGSRITASTDAWRRTRTWTRPPTGTATC